MGATLQVQVQVVKYVIGLLLIGRLLVFVGDSGLHRSGNGHIPENPKHRIACKAISETSTSDVNFNLSIFLDAIFGAVETIMSGGEARTCVTARY